jgi:hypothetical protein
LVLRTSLTDYQGNCDCHPKGQEARQVVVDSGDDEAKSQQLNSVCSRSDLLIGVGVFLHRVCGVDECLI